jgi:hypothetical protein
MKKDVLKVGTLINDNGRMAVISKVIEVGELKPTLAYISWRANYEIRYTDGTKLIIGCRALDQMIENGVVEVYGTTTLLPPSSIEDLEAHLQALGDSMNDSKEN